MKKLVLFIHGLGGSSKGTWEKFPELMRKDAELAEEYAVEAIDYSSGAFGSKPGLPTCAVILKTEIENRYPDYADIALIAHSQGGLVARYYIAERINSTQPLRVSRLLTFATPHQGSGLATPLNWLPFTSQQSEDLDPNSEFMQALGVAWGQAKADRRVLTKYVVAAGDAIVGQVSAMGQWSPDYEVVSGVGHLAVVKPETADKTPFLIAKKFLLEDSLQPGGVEADYQAPLLRFNHVDSKKEPDTVRFIYSARVLPFIGRDVEKKILMDFLSGMEQPFCWMVMHGSGGVGKSRLALELCLAIRNEWHAGFLPQEGQEPDWGRWQPLMPTLIVIDYAARDTGRTGKLLRALAGRGPTDGTKRLAAPVRILLVERTGEGDWLDKIVGVGTTKAQVNAAHATANLPLVTIDDPWPIFEFVLTEKKKPLPDKTETLVALGKIDTERRPLFAYFMADAIANGHDIRDFDAARLLDQVIERGRGAYWKPAGATAEDERLLAVATMAGGLPVSGLDGVMEKLLPSWDIDRHPAIFLAMTGRESGENIAPLEPDIVGEHFALGCLAVKNLSNEARARLCGVAWRLNPLGMAQFTLRAHRDLPGHSMLHWVRKSPESEGSEREIWAKAAVNLMNDLPSSDQVAAHVLLNDIRSVAAKHDDDTLWGEWAKATFNLMYYIQSRDLTAARAMLVDMRGMAVKRDTATLWEQWARAAANLVDDLGYFGPGAMPEEIPLWDESLRVDPKDIRLTDPSTMQESILKVQAEPLEIRALSAEDLARVDAAFGPNPPGFFRCDSMAARVLLDDMRGVAAERDEAALWELWAKAAANLMRNLRNSDPGAARALLDDMRDVAGERDAAALWELWASAAYNLMIGLHSRDPGAAEALLDDIRGVADARDEAALRKQYDLASVYQLLLL